MDRFQAFDLYQCLCWDKSEKLCGRLTYPFCSVPRAAAAIKKGNTMQRISNETLKTSTI
jgi:hypothetical protein